MNRRQLKAMQLHATRLERAAVNATRHYEQLRATFPDYSRADRGLIMDAARVCDSATDGARRFREALTRVERQLQDEARDRAERDAREAASCAEHLAACAPTDVCPVQA